jgi:hypothetical protein
MARNCITSQRTRVIGAALSPLINNKRLKNLPGVGKVLSIAYNHRALGVWRRLVARSARVGEVIGSIPVTPTSKAVSSHLDAAFLVGGVCSELDQEITVAAWGGWDPKLNVKERRNQLIISGLSVNHLESGRPDPWCFSDLERHRRRRAPT